MKQTEETIQTFGGTRKMMRPANGEKIKLTQIGLHGDWKTALVHSERWPAIPAGTEVEVVGFMQNLEGCHMRVKFNNSTYDIPTSHFEQKGFSRWY